jgi:hypothetical protein
MGGSLLEATSSRRALAASPATARRQRRSRHQLSPARLPCEDRRTPPRTKPVITAPSTQKGADFRALCSTATGIRTRVSAMRGRRPSPLDDSGAQLLGSRLPKRPEPSPARRVGRHRSTEPSSRHTLYRSRCTRASSQRACVRYLRPSPTHADVAELVDAHGSGPCLGDQVEVRVLSSALDAPERSAPKRKRPPRRAAV